MTEWACNPDVAAAVAETAGMSRDALIARLNWLAPAATDEALREAVVGLMTAPKRERWIGGTKP
jgi:hypothetical protein